MGKKRAGAGLAATGISGLVVSVIIALAAPLAVTATGVGPALAAQPGGMARASGLPVPRFVSLKAGRANVRVGPGRDYKVEWVFTRSGLPVEVIQEYDNWRRVRDSDGSVGWIFHSLLSGKRTVVVAPWAGGEPVPIFGRASGEAAVAAYLESGVMGEVERCTDNWCLVYGERFEGWIRQDQLWGVYPDEVLD